MCIRDSSCCIVRRQDNHEGTGETSTAVRQTLTYTDEFLNNNCQLYCLTENSWTPVNGGNAMFMYLQSLAPLFFFSHFSPIKYSVS